MYPTAFAINVLTEATLTAAASWQHQPDNTQRGRDPSGGGEGRQWASRPAFQLGHTSKVFTTFHLQRGLFCSSSPSVSWSNASASLLLLDPTSQRDKCQKRKQKPQASQTFVGAVI